MTNILLCGISGKMGKTVLNLLENEKDAKAVCGVAASAPENADIPVYNSFDEVREKPDVIIDFSSPNALGGLLGYAVKNKIPCVLATTGYSEKQLREIENASKEIAIFKTANFSLGVNLLKKLLRSAKTSISRLSKSTTTKRSTHRAAPRLCSRKAQIRRLKIKNSF